MIKFFLSLNLRLALSMFPMSFMLLSCKSSSEVDEASFAEANDNKTKDAPPQVAFQKKKKTPVAVPEANPIPTNEELEVANSGGPQRMTPFELVLPLPKSPNAYFTLELLRNNRPLYQRFLPFSAEYDIYYRVLVKHEGKGDLNEERQALYLRIDENLERAHWLLVWSFKQSYDQFSKHATTLEGEKIDFFIKHMKIINFIADRLDSLGGFQKYFTCVGEFYRNMNENYLKRAIKERDRP